MTRHTLLISAAIVTLVAAHPFQHAFAVEGIQLAQAAPNEPQQQKPGQKPPQRPAGGAQQQHPGPGGAQQRTPPGPGPGAQQQQQQQHQQGPATAATPPANTPPGNATQGTPPGKPPGRTPPGRTPPAGAVVQTPPPGAPANQPGTPPPQTKPGGAPAVVQAPPPGPPAGQLGQQRPGGAPAIVQTPPPGAPGAPPGAGGPPGQARPGAPAAVMQVPPTPTRPGGPVVVNAPVDPRAMPQHLEQLRNERHEVREGDRLVIQEADRTIVREGGHDFIRHDEAGRFRFNAREVNTERRGDLTVTVVVRPDGSRIITEVAPDGRLVRRLRRDAFGREEILIDNSFEPRGPGFAGYFVELPAPTIRIPREVYIREANRASMDDIYATLMSPPVDRIERRYALDEIRYSEPLRARMPRVDIDTVNFETGSWEVAADQVERLAFVAQSILRAIQRNPREVFMVEGYTDAVGNDVDNLSLSDRRAESVAVVLTNVYNVPAENLVTQGYGKQFLKVPTDGPERANRRVSIQRITPLLAGQG